MFQADAYGGYDKLYVAGRQPGPIQQAGCWAYGRRKFFIYADVEAAAHHKVAGKKPVVVSPFAVEVVRQIDALFAIERDINGQSPQKRRAVRQDLTRPLVEALHAHLALKRLEFSRNHDLYKAINDLLKRWPAFTLFLEDGRVCMSNNAAEQASALPVLVA